MNNVNLFLNAVWNILVILASKSSGVALSPLEFQFIQSMCLFYVVIWLRLAGFQHHPVM
jgi:hypothetical protein